MRLNTLLISLILFCGAALPHVAHAALTDGLVLHYTFETISGNTVTDASGNNRNGTLMGNPSVVTGHSGKAVSFPTVDDYLVMPQSFINSLSSFTVATWVKLSSLNSWSRIWDLGSGTGYYMFLTPYSGGSNLRFAIKNGGGEQTIDAPTSLTMNQWVHVAVTFDWNAQTSVGTGRIFVNGVQVGINTNMTINMTMLPPSTQNYIAKSQWPDPTLSGMVDDFRIYDRALSSVELMEINGYPSELVQAYNSINLAGDLTQVKGNLTLPTTAGTAAYPITWSSSSPNCVSVNGTVTRPKYYNETVTLTASISAESGGKSYSMTKEFNLTVISIYNTHWESLVLETDTFSYLPANSAPPTGWNQPSFNASTWKTGKGGIGFADNDDNTVVSQCRSLYLRRQVNIADTSQIDQLVLDIDYDDAFVLYINGVEAARSSNITVVNPAYNSGLTTDHEAAMYSGGSPSRFMLKSSMLVNGTNTFALQILNVSATSTDLSSRVFISGRLHTEGLQYHQVPAWFTEPVSFESSNLPLVFINTNQQAIVQSDKIVANMKVLNNPSGLNFFTDTTYEYNGFIGIEIRGFSSATFPKKNYTVETRVDSTNNLNVPLLGMPKENDWVFHGPYPDKSLMRNVLAYHLGNQVGRWSPRTRFFELYINGNYQGVYVLVERIKIDKNRANLATLLPTDTIGDEVTGGYVLKLDRPESTDVENLDYWVSPYRASTTLQQKQYFLFQDPKGDELNKYQFNYIRNHITQFEDAMFSNSYTDKETGYLPFINLQSFVDYYILTELSRNLDGYRVSTFLHKDKDSKGGKITMGPYWDYDIAYGNANFFNAGDPVGWVIDGMGNGDQTAMPFWWQKFRLDPYFNDQLKKRWNYWTSTFINTTHLNQFIDSCATVLLDAQKRNFQTWTILSTYVWPNKQVTGSYAGELSYLKSWLSNRINWMDSQIQAIQELPDKLTTNNLPMDLVTYPNPFVEQVTFKYYLASEGNVSIVIRDLMGRIVFSAQEVQGAGVHELPIRAGQLGSNASMYLYQVSVDGVVRKTGKLMKR